MNEDVVDVAAETAQRIAKGWLNGTSRGQAYLILAATALTGMAAGTVGTTVFIKKRFTLVPKFTKVPVEPVVVPQTPENGGKHS